MITMMLTALAPVALGFAGVASFGIVGNAIGHMRQNLYSVFYRGPECVVDIVGADLNPAANHMFDKFTRPDVKVECLHGRLKRTTPTEFNEYAPRFYFSSKMPYRKGEGFVFTVLDHDITKGVIVPLDEPMWTPRE